MINEYEVVIAKRKLSENVPAGSKGVILLRYDNNDYEVEFVNKKGDTLSVLTVAELDLELA